MPQPFIQDSKSQGTFITPYSGDVSNIPEGWVLCDGNNGTPNLLGKFLKGVSSASKNPGDTGGSETKTLNESQLGSHSHGGSTDSNGNHDHSVELELNDSDGPYDDGIGFGSWAGVDSNPGGNHNHSISTNNTGGGSSYSNLPSYVEIAYIMKL